MLLPLTLVRAALATAAARAPGPTKLTRGRGGAGGGGLCWASFEARPAAADPGKGGGGGGGGAGPFPDARGDRAAVTKPEPKGVFEFAKGVTAGDELEGEGVNKGVAQGVPGPGMLIWLPKRGSGLSGWLQTRLPLMNGEPLRPAVPGRGGGGGGALVRTGLRGSNKGLGARPGLSGDAKGWEGKGVPSGPNRG